MKKILLLYAVPHSGHAQVAHALSEALATSGLWKPTEDNVLGYFPRTGPVFMKFYRWVIFNRSEIWGHFHDNPNYESAAHVLEDFFYNLDALRLEKILKRHKPDAVLVTHAFPLRALAALKARGKIRLPLYAVVTDFRAHRYWAHKAVDHYFVASAGAKSDLIRYGVAASKISVTGIPVRQEFLNEIDRSRVLQSLEFGSDPAGRGSKKIILVMGGSYGVVPFEELLDAAQHHARLKGHQWIFVFGNNQRGFSQAKKSLKPENFARVRLFGFADDVASLMAISDVMVSKAGALSASEALVLGLPVVIYRPMAGQETKNADFLIRSGAALRADSKDKLLSLLAKLMENTSVTRSMRLAAKRIAKSDAVRKIVAGLSASEV